MAKPIVQSQIFQLGARIDGLPSAVASGQPVVLEQMLAVVNGNPFKDDCRLAATGNVSLASAPAAYDTITATVADRILLLNQTAQTENGIYVFAGAGQPLVRAADAANFNDLEGAVVTVTEGATAAGRYRQTQVNGVIGTNNVLFVSDATAVPQATETISGISEIATQAETNTGTADNLIVTPLKLATSVYAQRSITQVIGDGTAASFTITHNYNTRNVEVTISETSGLYRTVEAEVRRNLNDVVVVMAGAPPANSYSVTVERL